MIVIHNFIPFKNLTLDRSLLWFYLTTFFSFQAALFAISTIFETYERVPVFVSIRMLDYLNRKTEL